MPFLSDFMVLNFRLRRQVSWLLVGWVKQRKPNKKIKQLQASALSEDIWERVRIADMC